MKHHRPTLMRLSPDFCIIMHPCNFIQFARCLFDTGTCWKTAYQMTERITSTFHCARALLDWLFSPLPFFHRVWRWTCTLLTCVHSRGAIGKTCSRVRLRAGFVFAARSSNTRNLRNIREQAIKSHLWLLILTICWLRLGICISTAQWLFLKRWNVVWFHSMDYNIWAHKFSCAWLALESYSFELYAMTIPELS